MGMKDTADVISKIGFRMFLGITTEVGNFSQYGRSFSLFISDNPLSIFVELPESTTTTTTTTSNIVDNSSSSETQQTQTQQQKNTNTQTQTKKKNYYILIYIVV